MNDYIGFNSLQVKEAALERFRLSARLAISDKAVLTAIDKNSVLEHYVDELTQRQIYQISTFLIKGEAYSETRVLEDRRPYEVPENWWQHLKADLRRVAPRWAKDWIKPRFIVKWVKFQEEVPVTVVKCCPHGDFEWGENLHYHVRWLEDPNPPLIYSNFTTSAPLEYRKDNVKTCPQCGVTRVVSPY